MSWEQEYLKKHNDLDNIDFNLVYMVYHNAFVFRELQ